MKKMKKFLILALSAAFIFPRGLTAREKQIEPSGTYIYAEKDGTPLYMDVYDPAEGSAEEIDGIRKPTVLFLFGGGFKGGRRDHPVYTEWFEALVKNGYRVASIDYRLGMKDNKDSGIAQINAIHRSVEMAVEDLFSATNYILANASSLGIAPSGIVIAGSSAGAMTVLQAGWEMSNGGPLAAVLPEGFSYAGIISFSGAVFSDRGTVRYAKKSVPTLLFHGTNDKLVTYRQIKVFKRHMAGSSPLAAALKKSGAACSIYRFDGNGHEICNSMLRNLDDELRFIETDIMKNEGRTVDATIVDPAIEPFRFGSLRDLYKHIDSGKKSR